MALESSSVFPEQYVHAAHTQIALLHRINCVLHILLCEQVRQWNKELEARPSDLHGFARLKQRHQVMEAQKGELFKVGCARAEVIF